MKNLDKSVTSNTDHHEFLYVMCIYASMFLGHSCEVLLLDMGMFIHSFKVVHVQLRAHKHTHMERGGVFLHVCLLVYVYASVLLDIHMKCLS